MAVIAFVPLRGGSKGVPKKNIRKLNGRPLAYYLLKSFNECPEIDRVVVSTEDPEIDAVVNAMTNEEGWKTEVLMRPIDLSRDESSTEEVILNAIEQIKNLAEDDVFVLGQATNVFTLPSHIAALVEAVQKSDSALTVTKKHLFLWGENGQAVNYSPARRPRRQDWDGLLIENGALYASRVKEIRTSKCRISGRIGTVCMPEVSCYEIDTMEDWTVVEALVKLKKETGYWD